MFLGENEREISTMEADGNQLPEVRGFEPLYEKYLLLRNEEKRDENAFGGDYWNE